MTEDSVIHARQCGHQERGRRRAGSHRAV